MTDHKQRPDIERPEASTSFVPALRFAWLTKFFDPLMQWTLPERAFKEALIRQAAIQDSHYVLDLGCGTGTLMIAIKKVHPTATVMGLDADKRIISIAKRKAAEAHVALAFYRGLASKIPAPDASVHRVLSSLFFHHLTRSDKAATLKEACRVLRPDGQIHIGDWGRPANALMKAAFLSVRILDGFDRTADSVRGALPQLMSEAGFQNVREGDHFNTIFGTLRLFQGRKAAR